jgi:putative copper export protein
MFVVALVALLILGGTIAGLIWLLSKLVDNPRTQPEQKAQTKQDSQMAPNEANARGLSGFEWVARFYVWVFGLMLAVLTVLGVIPIIPANTGVWLLILLIIFMFAMLVTLYSDLRHLHPLRKRQQTKNKNRQQD